jgi:pimeloyl-ACP methyl ester carboxylesterase
MESDHLQLDWQSGASSRGVTLRWFGAGESVFLLPGMEGSGESCLHVAVPVIRQAGALGRAYRLVLVDYAGERHATLAELVATVHDLVREDAGEGSCVIWGQSFGNLLATGALVPGDIQARRVVLVSAFTALPQLKVVLGSASLTISPSWLYRLTIDPLGRYVFGPSGDQPHHPFFAALRGMDPRVAARRIAWLRSATFATRFTDLSAPVKTWLGERDRLVSLPEQEAFFSALTRRRPDCELSIVEGAGHVFLPSAAVQFARREILQWLLEGR